jgi:hypothetical protein
MTWLWGTTTTAQARKARKLKIFFFGEWDIDPVSKRRGGGKQRMGRVGDTGDRPPVVATTKRNAQRTLVHTGQILERGKQ